MLKLYYAPGGCSISPHIALREASLPFSLEKVDFKSGKKLADGTSFLKVNPKGYIPALGLPDGQVLTEGVAIVQYIADLKPEAALAPHPGTFERVRLQEWLNFIATEMHKGLTAVLAQHSSDEAKQAAKEKLASRLAYTGQSLGSKDYLLGKQFSVADGYMFYVLRAWQRFAKGELSDGLAPYYQRLRSRPSVKAALEAEGVSG
jgi:glutathione S-transferase